MFDLVHSVNFTAEKVIQNFWIRSLDSDDTDFRFNIVAIRICKSDSEIQTLKFRAQSEDE